MKDTIKPVPGALTKDRRAKIVGSQTSQTEKLPVPNKEETPVAAESPKKQLIRVEITLMPTYKPSRK